LGKLWRGLGWVTAVVVVLGVVGRVVFFDAWTLPDDPKTSAAVAPTLAGGDTILFMRRGLPGFGDLVRCTDPDDKDPEHPTRFVVARVVGLAGDVVETNGRDLSVNGKRYFGQMACADEKISIPHPTSGSTVDLWCDQVEMAGHPHFRGSSDKAGIFTPSKVTVGQGMLFVLSDDRSYHDDSRDFGTLPAASCSGRFVFRLWGKEGWGDSKRRMTYVQ
jgi:signal peptidase I